MLLHARVVHGRGVRLHRHRLDLRAGRGAAADARKETTRTRRELAHAIRKPSFALKPGQSKRVTRACAAPGSKRRGNIDSLRASKPSKGDVMKPSLALITVIAILLFTPQLPAQLIEQPRTVSTTGESIVRVAPDQVIVGV